MLALLDVLLLILIRPHSAVLVAGVHHDLAGVHVAQPHPAPERPGRRQRQRGVGRQRHGLRGHPRGERLQAVHPHARHARQLAVLAQDGLQLDVGVPIDNIHACFKDFKSID